MAVINKLSHLILVFDWGNTLMKVDPKYSGPMVDWPEVAGVEGVTQALEALHGTHTMIVATNAADSSAAQVREALRRADLDKYFSAVFTSRELGGARKPDARFFRQIESVLGRSPQEMVMVSDDYSVDILGAKSAGWYAAWYNAQHQAAPGLLPLHDAELQTMRDLPQMERQLALPGYPTCLAWLAERGTPYNILAHIQLVAAISYQLAMWFIQAGEAVDPLLTQRGAMLHDLAKMESIRGGKEGGRYRDHGEWAYHLLLERQQPELAEIANRHMVFTDPNYPRRPVTWSQKLVNYADKLAEGAQLVAIEERLQSLQSRYPDAAKDLEESLPVLMVLQDEICERLSVRPVELIARLQKSLGAIPSRY